MTAKQIAKSYPKKIPTIIVTTFACTAKLLHRWDKTHKKQN